MRRFAFGAWAVLALAGCGGSGEETPVVEVDSGPLDTGASVDSTIDSTPVDSGSVDSAAEDTAIADADAATDTAIEDTGVDSGPIDSGPDDAGPADTGPADTGPADTGPADTGPADTGPADTGSDSGDAGSPTIVPSPAPTISFPGMSVTTSRGGTGGGELLHACPTGQALIGIEAQPTSTGSFYAGTIGRYASICGAVTVVAGSSPGTWNITVGGGSRLPSSGHIGSYSSLEGSMATATCPANQVAVGFEGRATSSGPTALGLRCAPLTVTGTPGSFAVGVGTVTTTTIIGSSGGTGFAATNCAAGEVANGASLRVGEVLDAFAMRCGKPTLAFVAPTSIVLTSAAATTTRGGTGGGPLLESCPTGQVPIGIEVQATGGFYSGAIGRYATRCGTMTVAAGTTAGTYVINTASGTRMPATGHYGSYGLLTGTMGTATCPAGSVAIGFDGRADGSYMFALGLRCAPVQLNGSTSAGFAFGLGTPTATTILGSSGGGTAFAATNCGAGTIASGIAIRAGEVLDNYGLTCSNANLSY